MSYNKYKNNKLEIDNIRFDSEAESKFYIALKNNNIEFTMRDTFELQPKFKYKNKTILPIKYVSDFKVDNIVIDIKGMKTTDFKLKEKMFKYIYGGTLDLVCLAPCPKKYLELIKDEKEFWNKLGFIEYDTLIKLRKGK